MPPPWPSRPVQIGAGCVQHSAAGQPHTAAPFSDTGSFHTMIVIYTFFFPLYICVFWSASATLSKGSMWGKAKSLSQARHPVYSSQSDSMHFASLISTVQLYEHIAEADARQGNLALSTRDREEKASSLFQQGLAEATAVGLTAYN